VTPFQVDSALPLIGTRISRRVGLEAARLAELLVRLSPAPDGPPHLAAQRRAFVARYGAQRAVPLLEVVDEDLGLGPIEHGAPDDRDHGFLAERRATRDQTLIDLATGALRDRRTQVELDDDLIARLVLRAPRVASAPPSLDINVFVAAASYEALDAGQFDVILGPNLGATSAGRSLGRFADLLGARALEALRRAADPERAVIPGCTDAELVYMPRMPRSANVAIRPALRRREIVVGVTPGVDWPSVIPLDELLVCVAGNRFAVRWAETGEFVRVHEGHMLNGREASPAVRFLAEIGRDGVSAFSPFDWGPAEYFPMRPRVRCGRLVLRPAEWRLDGATREEMLGARSGPLLRSAMERWREAWQVPRYVHVGHGDNRLLVDLESASNREQLADEIRIAGGQTPSTSIQEALPAPDQHWLTGPGGHYVAELVVSLARRRPATDRTHPDERRVERREPILAPLSIATRNERWRPPGSDWLYARLYGARSGEDDLLATEIRAFAAQSLGSGHADDWFYLRYADDGYHLRLRFHGDGSRLTTCLLPRLCAWSARLIDKGVCRRFMLDTYERELERYGGIVGLPLAERIFGADSRATVEMLDLRRRKQFPWDPTLLAMLSIEDLLESLGLDDERRTAWYEHEGEARDLVGTEYRTRKQEMREALADRAGFVATHSQALARAFSERRAAIEEPARLLRACFSDDETGDAVSNVNGSIVHLHCNRLLGATWQGERRLLALLLRTREGLARTISSDSVASSVR
jgi:thiopeptide-type bacteriocin biosynthesis protein